MLQPNFPRSQNPAQADVKVNVHRIAFLLNEIRIATQLHYKQEDKRVEAEIWARACANKIGRIQDYLEERHGIEKKDLNIEL